MIAYFFLGIFLIFQITIPNVALNQEYCISRGLSLTHFFLSLHVLRDIIEFT